MSRSNYTDECEDNWSMICWRGAVAAAIRGKRGQAFLREMLAALDAMQVKELIAEELETAEGAVCALGSVGHARGMDMSNIDYETPSRVGAAFGISRAMAAEIEFENDEGGPWQCTPAQRFIHMRNWVLDQIEQCEARTARIAAFKAKKLGEGNAKQP